MEGIRGIRRIIISIGWILISIFLFGYGFMGWIPLVYVAVIVLVIGIIQFIYGIYISKDIDEELKNMYIKLKNIERDNTV